MICVYIYIYTYTYTYIHICLYSYNINMNMPGANTAEEDGGSSEKCRAPARPGQVGS